MDMKMTLTEMLVRERDRERQIQRQRHRQGHGQGEIAIAALQSYKQRTLKHIIRVAIVVIFLFIASTGKAVTKRYGRHSETKTHRLRRGSEFQLGEAKLYSKTVNSYRYRIFEKLAVRNDVELTLLAIRHGLKDEGDSEDGQSAIK